jgi:hypothetical protein
MDRTLLTKHIEAIGARVRFEPGPDGRGASRFAASGIDVREDKRGEHFLLNFADDLPVEVIDSKPNLRHLLLLVREGAEKQKFLLGHDERHWFVAAVPGQSVRSVGTAMAALRPAEVQSGEGRVRRQGEWFFVPRPVLNPNPNLVHRNEPISRGRGSKPHVCEELFRTGGVTVCVCRQRPNGVSENEMNAIIAARPEARLWNWRRMVRDASVYVRGKIRHADHATLRLDGWHQVYLNNERFASWAEQVVFLD